MYRYICILLVLCGLQSMAQSSKGSLKVCRLTVDLIEETDVVFSNGSVTNIPISDFDFNDPNLQVAEISTTRPHFGWQIVSKNKETFQSQYRLLVATSPDLLAEGSADIWDSGIVDDRNSTGVEYQGRPLSPGSIYYYTVKVYDQKQRCSEYAEPKGFVVSTEPDEASALLPLQKSDQMPVLITHPRRTLMLDFGKDAFSQIKFHFSNVMPNQVVTIRLGEVADSNGVVIKPGGSRRYASYQLTLDSVRSFYEFTIRNDKRNTNPNENESGVSPIFMPNYIGQVFPFRYCQIEGYNGAFLYRDAVRSSVSYPFDEMASDFYSSDTILNQLWDLSKHSLRTTTFAGLFVDGDRERIPYETATLINQLSHYSVDYHYSIARATLEHLINNPTNQTEGILQTLFIAWNDYLYSGDDRILKKYYPVLKDKTLMFLRSDDGLIRTGNKITNLEHLQRVNFRGREIRDLIDAPECETDGYERGVCNTVVNAFHYKALLLLADIANAIGNRFDADNYIDMASATRNSINAMLTDSCGFYIDNLATSHTSLHANLFPLAFGIVDNESRGFVKNFVQSKGMACSVYGAQYLFDALYDNGLADSAFKLLTDTTKRSFYNMIRSGSTITTEAWDMEFKPDQDWNHAWGASPANIIVRKIMGVEPLSPGFASLSVAPKPSTLQHADITVPTPRGSVCVSFENTAKKFDLRVSVPPNCRAKITLPYSQQTMWVGSGKHHFSESRK
ncbi:MAG: alpha-L-rhamnosidase [Bacteroidales bacterium]|nr:alpha-L-rhamnosidase [Bacteroidales bacterium]